MTPESQFNSLENRLDRIEDILVNSAQSMADLRAVVESNAQNIARNAENIASTISALGTLGNLMEQMIERQRAESERQSVVNARWDLEHAEFRAALERIDRILDYLMGQGDRPA